MKHTPETVDIIEGEGVVEAESTSLEDVEDQKKIEEQKKTVVTLQEEKERAAQKQKQQKALLEKELKKGPAQESKKEKTSDRVSVPDQKPQSSVSKKRTTNIRKRLKKFFSFKGSWWKSEKKSHEKGSWYENLVVQKDFDLCKLLYKMNLKNGNMAKAQMALEAMKNTALTQEQKETYEAYANDTRWLQN